MRHFRPKFSTPLKQDQNILNFVYKDVQIPDTRPEIKQTFKVNSQQHLDDVIETVLSSSRARSLISDGDALDDMASAASDIVNNAKPKNKIDEILYKIFNFKPSSDPGAFFNATRAKALTVFCVRMAYIVARALARSFVEAKLAEFAAQKVDKQFKNGKLYNWFKEQVDRAYKLHPEYKPMPIEEFKKTSQWNRFRSEWLDKTRPQVIRRMSLQTLYTVLYCLSLESNLPFAFLYEIPTRIVLAYLGVRLGIGSINDIVIDFEGNTIALGVSYTKLGYELTYPELLCKREDGKMVRVDLQEVPPELYAITKEDIEEVEKEGVKLKQ